MPLALLALVFATFAIGTSEFIIVGLIPGIARDVAVSTPAAGLLVSAYAFTIMVGTPIVTALTGRWPRRPLLLALMAVFSLSNFAAGLAPGYATLMAARIVMALSQGAFFGVAAVVAAALVEKSKGGEVQGVLLSGVTVAMIVGVPFGTWLGQLAGWRMPFIAIGVLGVVAFAALAVLVPRSIAHEPPARALAQLGILADRRLLTLYAISALGFGSTFVVFTFLSPLLTGVTGVKEATVGTALLIFGGATFVGSLFGGKLSDAIGMRKAMFIVLAGLVASLALIWATVHNDVAILVNVGVWGIFGFAVPPIMQAAVVRTAQEGEPWAVGTASGFNISAFNLGIGGGSFLGGRLFDGPGVLSTPAAGIALAVLALVFVALSRRRIKPLVASPEAALRCDSGCC